MRNSIVVNNLGKIYRRYHAHRPFTLQEAILGGLNKIRPLEYLWALRGLTFSVEPGHTVGVIGPNGAGKSTLLRLIGGVMKPDEGTVEAHGSVGSLLDLGAGFHTDLTGRENVFISGVISGLTRREVSERFDSIVAFSELEEFIDSPVRTYSTGMLMRLAFAVAVHVDPEILLVDEVLSVGDISFQHKCQERIKKFKADGCTIILVTHDTDSIRELCDAAIWLRSGRMMACGTADEVVSQYIEDFESETRRRTPADWPSVRTSMGTELRMNENRWGSMELEISSVRLLDQSGSLSAELDSGDSLRVEINFVAHGVIESPIFGVTITRADKLVCYDTSTWAANRVLPKFEGEGKIVLQLDRLDLNAGLYYVNVDAYDKDWTYYYDSHWNVYAVVVRSKTRDTGVIRPPHRWELDNGQTL